MELNLLSEMERRMGQEELLFSDRSSIWGCGGRAPLTAPQFCVPR